MVWVYWTGSLSTSLSPLIFSSSGNGCVFCHNHTVLQSFIYLIELYLYKYYCNPAGIRCVIMSVLVGILSCIWGVWRRLEVIAFIYIPPELQLCTDIMEHFRGLNVQYSSTHLFIIKATLLTNSHILKSSAWRTLSYNNIRMTVISYSVFLGPFIMTDWDTNVYYRERCQKCNKLWCTFIPCIFLHAILLPHCYTTVLLY